MSETVNLPGIGRTSKTTAYVIGGGLVLVVAISWYRSRNAPAAAAPAAAAPTDQTASDATGGTDPSLSGGGSASNWQAGPVIGYTGGGSPVYGGGPSTPGAYTTNGQWSQAAEDYLVNTVGGHADVVGNALGKYITGRELTPDQVAIVTQAIAFVGYPPANGPSGYPPSYRTSSTTPPPSTVPTNIPTARFVRVTRTTSWDALAKAYAVFGGNGRALYEYNLLPGKHEPQSYQAVQASWPTIHGHPRWEVDLPKRGLKVQLPVVGIVTS